MPRDSIAHFAVLVKRKFRTFLHFSAKKFVFLPADDVCFRSCAIISRVKLRRSVICPLAICVEMPYNIDAKIISAPSEEPTTPAEMVEILKK